MLQNAQHGGEAEFDSARQANRAAGPDATDNSVSMAGGGAAVKADEPTANANAQHPGNGGELNEFEFTPTPFSPHRIDRCRIESFVMLFMLLLTFVFGVVALSTQLTYYKSSTLTMDVYCLQVWGINADGVRQHYSTRSLFCGDFAAKTEGFAALFIMTVLLSVLGFVLALVPIICGRVLLCPYLVQSLMLVCWFFVMIALILGAQVRNNRLCRDTSLKSIGFSYGPAFGVAAALFALLSVTMIFLVVRMFTSPAVYRS